MSARSGTERRQRTHQVGVRLNDAEYEALLALAAASGISPGAALRRYIVRTTADAYRVEGVRA